MSVVSYRDINTSEFCTGCVSKNNYGGQQVWLNYNKNNRSKLFIQTPEMKAPFGVSEYVADEQNGPKYSLDVSFQDNDGFKEMIESMDRMLIEQAVSHSTTWFGKKMSHEIISELYRPLVKPSKQPEKYSSTMKFKIQPTRIKIWSKVDNSPLTMDDITKGSMVKAIFSISPVWFVNKQFGVSCTIEQLLLAPNETGSTFVFEED